MYKLVDNLEGEVFVLKVRETKVVYNHYAVKGVDKEGAVETKAEETSNFTVRS